MPKLSKRVIDAAKPEAKQRFLWDDNLKGFGLLVLPSGKKSFVLQYRTLAGRSRRLTLGQYGVLTPSEAKHMAADALTKIRKGEDPLAARHALRTAPTINDLMDRYLSDHVLVHNAKSTQVGVKSVIKTLIRPHLGPMKLSEISRRDIAEFHAKLSKTPRQANHLLAVLSKAFNLAEVWGWRPEQSNPVRLIKRYRETERDRFLTDVELARLGKTLDEAERIGLPWVVRASDRTRKHLPRNEADWRTPVSKPALQAVRLLLFTGARLSEILTLEWSHVDLANGTIALPSRKGDGRKAHPVSQNVLQILSHLAETKCSKYVLPRDQDRDRHVSKEVVENAWQRIRRHADLLDVRLHDLRHTFGTFGGQAGGNAFLISHLLRHRNVTITHRYVNSDMDPIRGLSDVIGQRISDGLTQRPTPVSDPQETTGNVVEFPRRHPTPR